MLGPTYDHWKTSGGEFACDMQPEYDEDDAMHSDYASPQEHADDYDHMRALELWLAKATEKELNFAEKKIKYAKDAARAELTARLKELGPPPEEEKKPEPARSPTGRQLRRDRGTTRGPKTLAANSQGAEG